jgi:pimeloyl-ACP methyl ester carboxylesterase
LAKRLHRIAAPTLLLWGSDDRVVAPQYSDLFTAGIGGDCKSRIVAGAGHLAYVDKPDEVADAVLEFVGDGAPAV